MCFWVRCAAGLGRMAELLLLAGERQQEAQIHGLLVMAGERAKCALYPGLQHSPKTCQLGRAGNRV